MKKILVIFAAVLLLTGCGSKSLDVTKTKADKFNELNYSVPEAFEKKDAEKIETSGDMVFSDFTYSFDTIASNGKYDDACYLSFFYDTGFNDYTLEKYAEIFHENETGTKKTINGVEWIYYVDKLSESMVDYNYYARYNNTWYEVSYSDWGSGDSCGQAYEPIINSLRFGN